MVENRLKRLVHACRDVDMAPLLERVLPQLSMIFDQTMDFINTNWGHRLQTFNQGWFSRPCLQNFYDSIYRKGAAVDIVWGLFDGTICPICRPKDQQGILYKGRALFHAFKFQSVTTPSGMIANLNVSVEMRTHD